MSNILTQENLDIRLQRLICCIGTLGGEIQGMIAVGNDCYKEKLAKLKILIGYLRALECYSIEDEEVLSTGILSAVRVAINNSVEIFANGISISGLYTATTGNLNQELYKLALAINAYQNSYVATFNGIGSGTITITGLCSNPPLTVEADVAFPLQAIGMSGGICTTNCLTEEQILKMFDRVSEYCDICFPGADYTYIK